MVGKTVFITGGGSGIGRATALALGAMGASVFVMGRDAGKLRSLAADMPAGRCAFHAGDVAEEGDVHAAFQACGKVFGRLHGLVNNAGIGIPTPDLASANLEALETMYRTNVRGTFLCTREALGPMKAAGGGHIVNIVSVAGQKTNPTAPLYCASKFAQRAIGSGTADQFLKQGIKVTEVNPSATDSAYWGDRKVAREKMLKPEDVAAVIAWVLSTPAHVLIRQVDVDSMAWVAQ